MADSATARPVAPPPEQATAGATGGHANGQASGAAMGPADVAMDQHEVRVRLPVAGTVSLPPPDELAFLAGMVALATAGLITWPVTLTIGAGHLLAHNKHMRLLRSFGEALEEA
ncbi:hypothetical protein A8924_1910 [Saccharopolyspora erythraea NRRL 2338]|uniref:Uncharacterized protein n=1 Tax=Saccharopolyspora erythraea TaxID=1836 RepID=A0ABN1BZQ9_SACER|nr:hypothetical protein [Saccharopolyspora erythraea]PFG94621.1 hypothetical protein A8924_1910 [Saccharopolyspora erythraea NRRL 2338]QRK91354.1 hypothetical protein JQX30_08110 [Saccharopolyspora erythraea]